jgi:hypothetical protein
LSGDGRPALYYDIGELGWTMYLAAHLRYLFLRGRPAAVAAPPSKEVFYRGSALEILPIPAAWSEKWGRFPSDGHHLYDPRTRRRIRDHRVLSAEFVEAYPQYEVVTGGYGRFPGETVFEPYRHSPGMEDLAGELFGSKRVILAFPRKRKGKFAGRNLPQGLWTALVRTLCDRFPDLVTVALGSSGGAIRGLDPGRENYRDLVGYDDSITLDLMVALCNTGRAAAAVGNQSGTVKITLLCGTPTFIVGHERERHTVDENWSGTRVGFHEAGSLFGPRLPFDRKASLGGYVVWNRGRLISRMTGFVEEALGSGP